MGKKSSLIEVRIEFVDPSTCRDNRFLAMSVPLFLLLRSTITYANVSDHA